MAKINLNEEECDELIQMLDTSTNVLFELVRYSELDDTAKQEAERRLHLQMSTLKRLTAAAN
jgi:hypothetical protein